MAKINRTTNLTLNEEEVEALKKLLGNITDILKKEAGLSSDQCRITSEIWDLLPYETEE